MTQQPLTIPDMFLHRISSTPNRVAFRYPSGSDWQLLTWKEFGERVRHFAVGLIELGLQPEQRVAILCSTRIEWIVADFAVLCASGATTTIYPSSTADDCQYIANDSNSIFVIAENDEQVEKLRSVRAQLGNVRNVIVIEGSGSSDGWVITLADIVERGRKADAGSPSRFEEIARSVRKEHLATLIYTSGTTGRPKGVELTHDCWVSTAEGMEALGFLGIDDVQYLWLPLAHSFGKVLEVAQLRVGFESAVDGRVDKIVDNLGVVRPTFVPAVPRIFEKVYNKIVTGAREAGGLKLKIFEWALVVGGEVSKIRQAGGEPSGILALKYKIATKLVFSKLQQRFGGRVKYFVSGSAPLSRKIAEFFHAAGMLILEGYGLTESSAASFVNRPEAYRFGSVGMPLQNVELKIADDGEILIRGRGIMRGYHNLPSATAEALDSNGWLHTGDIGEVQDGFLRITDRKKDLIKTSGGKYIAPQSLETKLKVACPFVSQVVVHGDNRNFVSMLIALDPEAITKWAGENGMGSKSYTEIVQSDAARALVAGYVDELNKSLPSFETVKKFAILPNDLTLESGDLTPSLKLKRKAVEKKYMGTLDDLYKGSNA